LSGSLQHGIPIIKLIPQSHGLTEVSRRHTDVSQVNYFIHEDIGDVYIVNGIRNYLGGNTSLELIK